MTEENKTDKKKCGGKGKAMFAYGIIQLGSIVKHGATANQKRCWKFL